MEAVKIMKKNSRYQKVSPKIRFIKAITVIIMISFVFSVVDQRLDIFIKEM
jgi:hypothetical protein